VPAPMGFALPRERALLEWMPSAQVLLVSAPCCASGWACGWRAGERGHTAQRKPPRLTG